MVDVSCNVIDAMWSAPLLEIGPLRCWKLDSLYALDFLDLLASTYIRFEK